MGRQLRYELILYATICFEAVVFALAARWLGAELGWLRLGVTASLMLFANRFLMANGRLKGDAILVPSMGVALLLTLLLLVTPLDGTVVGGLRDGLTGLLTFINGLPPPTVALILGILLWIRSVLIARSTATMMLTGRRIQIALIGLLLIVVQVASVRGGAVMPPVYGFLFIFGALTAFMLSRAHSVTRRTDSGVIALPFTPKWLATVGAAIGATLAVATFATLPFSLRGARLLYEVAAPLRYVVGVLVAALFYLLSILLGPLLDRIPMEDFFESFEEASRNIAGYPPPDVEPSQPITLNQALIDFILLLAFVAMVALAAYYLYKLLRQRDREEEELPEQWGEYDEEPLHWQGGAWLQSLRERLARKAARPEVGLETVRDLYKNLLLFGDDHGLPRPSEDTPYEYLDPLAARYPHRRQDFQQLTEAYVAAHYGETTFSAAQISDLKGAWQRINAEPRPLVDEG